MTYLFPLCSNDGMDSASTRDEIPSVASPATDEAARDIEMLSEMAELGLEFARAFQAASVKAIKDGDLDKAGEAHFSSLALGVRRAIALKVRLRERQEEARREAEDGWSRRQAAKDDRRRGVVRGVTRAIDTAPDAPEARERLTVDLWTRVSETDRIDADLADTALPIETLILRLCRDLGIQPHWPAVAAAAPAVSRTAPPPPWPRDWSPRHGRMREPDPALPREEDDTS
ncbi:hypothetical protein [Inquilinus sp. CA228]|uniref:hypothetical protein n=1 Tax=Inquilinus sp. CA228 TaxID=3455609 RepID=UPI003F8D0263